MADEIEEAEPPVVWEDEGGVAVISFNRPDELNVFSGRMASLLSAAYRECDERDDLRAVVLTGRGRAFCAGADMRPESASFGATAGEFSAQPLDPPGWAVRKPVIAAVNGHAVGIGFTLAMQCDIRIVANGAVLGVPQVRRGVLADAGSHWTIARAASQAVASDILLTGRTFDGREAVSLGLASQAVPVEEVLPTALARAREIASSCSPVSVALSKRILWDRVGLERTVQLETLYHRLLMGGPDAAEGPRAWMERREPRWTGSVNQIWSSVMEAESTLDELP